MRNRGWSAIKDPKNLIGPYAARDDQWVSYEDVSSVMQKVNILMQQKRFILMFIT